jgi:hypothetical protein
MPIRNDKPSQSGWLRLEDEEYHKVYDTMAGVGLAGRLIPEGQKRKHRHWLWWVAIAAGLGLLGAMVPNLLAWASGRGIRSVIGQFQKGVTGLDTRLPASNGQPNPAGLKPAASVSLPPSAPSQMTMPRVNPASGALADSDVSMTGYMRFGDEWLVSLSDGRMLSSHDVRFERLSQDGVKYDGKFYTRAYFNRSSVYQPHSSAPVPPVSPIELPPRSIQESHELDQPATQSPAHRQLRVHTSDGQTYFPGGGN